MNTGLFLRSFADEITQDNTAHAVAQQLSAQMHAALLTLPDCGTAALSRMSHKTGVPYSDFENFSTQQTPAVLAFINDAVAELVAGIHNYRNCANIINRDNIGSYPRLQQVYAAFRVALECSAVAAPTRPVVSANLSLNGVSVPVCGVLEKQYRLSVQVAGGKLTSNSVMVPDHVTGDSAYIRFCSPVSYYVPWIDELIYLYFACPNTIVLPASDVATV